MTPEQSLALEQLQRIAAVGDALEIVDVQRPEGGKTTLRVVVSVLCKDMPRVPAGLRLREREQLILWIGNEYPYDYPHVSVSHTRFAGFPHVNWQKLLCMYQAPHTEWSPNAGMAGFLERLELWLRKAALDQLDPVGGALHPPVVLNAHGPPLIPRVDAPVRDGQMWFGLAELTAFADHRIDLIGWKERGVPPHEGLVAAAILLDRPMPLEYPDKLGDLLRCLDERKVSVEELLFTIRQVLKHNGKDKPLYVVVGTPMRGTREKELRQHLACWRAETFAGEIADLEGRIAATEAGARDIGADQLAEEVADLRERVRALFMGWAQDKSLTWCRVREDRAEVTVRRDIGRPASAFAGKSVEVWGCGALGSYIAEWIIRAGAARVTLRDESQVTPGILVRQPYVDDDIGRAKAEVLTERLKRIRPSCHVEGIVGDILVDPLGSGKIGGVVDLVIDATASNLVLTRLEEVWLRHPESRCTIASIAIDRTADKLLVVLVHPDHSGGPFDAVRRMKLAACSDSRLRAYFDAFFPVEAAPAFQPEPGCSDATFVGSAADSAILASAATNVIGSMLQQDSATAFGCFSSSPGKESGPTVELEFPSDVVFVDPQTYFETRIAQSAWRTLGTWKGESQRNRGEDVETGGLLFGEMNEHLGVIWVSEASGPPPDSTHSADEFVCGIEGTQELNAEKSGRTRNTVQYVGTWHTHPVSAPVPSTRDLGAMAKLLLKSPTRVERVLLLIVGRTAEGPAVTASVFQRQEFESLLRHGFMHRQVAMQPAVAEPPVKRRPLGIALSGGGSRAMAFHLGCLRALHDRGLLAQAEVISTVSGGSVIGAMYAYSDDTFEEFEQRVRRALRQGFIWAIARRTLISTRLFQILATKAISGFAANASFIARFLIGQVESLLPRQSKATGLFAQQIQPPLRRWVTRTQAFEQTLRDLLFDGKKVDSPRRGDINVVINACELRTGTAFRFGNRESGSWRYGTISGNDVDVATAVAASAAYPALLPAIDRFFSFTKKDQVSRQRVLLTDGGVYENLGVSCMTPGRDDAYSTNVFKPPYIICCDAGPGQFDDVVLPYGWTTRMRRSFEATFRQTQYGLQKQLHMWREFGALEGFVYAYLGQQDERLPIIPRDLVRRADVVHYPTDFSPMSTTDIDLLSRRGEQLTRLLMEHYCPEL
jgi:integrative and conjugative element protein (TIGR02256 family)